MLIAKAHTHSPSTCESEAEESLERSLGTAWAT
jgi:hypothetical protein